MNTVFTYIPFDQITEQIRSEWSSFRATVPESKGFLYQDLKWVNVMSHLIPKEGIGLYLLRDVDTGKILIGSIGYRYPIVRQKYWLYFSRGPLFEWENRECLDIFLKHVRQFEKQAVWVRFDPAFIENADTQHFFSRFSSAHKTFHPKRTLLLDLTNSKDELLAQMHSKGRYNIRLAKKKDVRVYGWRYIDGKILPIADFGMTEEVEDPVGIFSEMIQETGKRDGFSVHSRAYFEGFLTGLGEQAFLLLSKQQDTWIGGGIFTTTKDTCIYYYGASLHQYRPLMAPYLVQWKAIEYAKEVLHLKTYDFLGIGSADSDPMLAGVTEFKRKFGGEERTFVGTFELKTHLFWFYCIRGMKLLRALTKKNR